MDYSLFQRLVERELGVCLIPEFKFHPTRKWRFDFAIPDLKIAIEIDGGLFIYGRHNHAVSMIKDYEKFNSAAALGWVVLKFIPSQLDKVATLDLIRNTVMLRRKEKSVCGLLKT